MESRSSNLKLPAKRNKYKSFLTSILSPSSKQSTQKEASTKFYLTPSLEEEYPKKIIGFETPNHSSDSLYAAIENLGEPNVSTPRREDAESLSCKFTKKSQSNIDLSSIQSHPVHDLNISKDSLYAIIQKSPNECKSKQNSELQDLKENNKILKERLKDLSADNRILRKKLQDFIKEEKRKENILHSNLHLKITEFESETRKEIKSLSDHIKILIREKIVFNDQLDLLQSEKKEIQLKFEESQKQLKNMIPPTMHKKIQVEHQRVISDLRKNHILEIEKLKEQTDKLEETKLSLENRVKELENAVTKTKMKLETLEKDKVDLLEKNKNLFKQAEESKQMEHDMQAMLLSLLKVTENVALEKNVLMNKTSFQDHQQKEIQTTVVDYSLNIGRLQEHVLNLNKDSHAEIVKLKNNKCQIEENMQRLYGKQFDILREKISVQNDIINDIKNDKRKLESQLELIWQAACGTNSKLLEDVKTVLQIRTDF